MSQNKKKFCKWGIIPINKSFNQFCMTGKMHEIQDAKPYLTKNTNIDYFLQLIFQDYLKCNITDSFNNQNLEHNSYYNPRWVFILGCTTGKSRRETLNYYYFAINMLKYFILWQFCCEFMIFLYISFFQSDWHEI